MQWGIYDTQDRCWLGDENGPKLFTEKIDARIAAEIFDVQLGQKTGRCEAREFEAQELVLKDEVPVKRDAVRAVRMLEHGYVN